MKNVKENKGITLIALVITIIVLLILVAVSIGTLTGENGILAKAKKAKDETQKAIVKEKVQIAILASYGTDGRLDISQLNNNLKNLEGLTSGVPITGNLPANIVVDGYNVKIESDGTVSIEGENSGNGETENPPTPPQPEKSELEQAKDSGTVLNEDNLTEIKDKYNNKIIVPEGFKIASDSAEDVTGGVVIEDVSHGATAGSQFVWIPIGNIKCPDGTTKTITLDRYTFDEDGTPTAQGSNKIDPYYQELTTSPAGNTTAKDIQAFKTSVTINGGYFIGRYEARSPIEMTFVSGGIPDDQLEQLTIKGNEYVYRYITQPQAAKLSREMYASNKKFTSDLMNSYAWDTVIIYLQTFDNRNDKSLPYSKQTSLTPSLSSTGTNNLLGSAKQDKICNIWDIASNMSEWTTETCDTGYENTAVYRGGSFNGLSLKESPCTRRNTQPDSTISQTFRPILYVNNIG